MTPLWAIGPISPDWLGLLASVWLLVDNRLFAPCWAGAIGLSGDLCSSGCVVAGMTIWLLTGAVVSRLKNKLPLDHPVVQAVVTFCLISVVSIWLRAVGWSTGEMELGLSLGLVRAVGVGVYTAGMSLPVFMIIAWFREPSLRRAAVLEHL